MTVYTYSQARQNFSGLLDIARRKGKVLVKRRDGQLFSIKPEKTINSPLDVKGIKTTIKTKEIVDIIRESRSRKG